MAEDSNVFGEITEILGQLEVRTVQEKRNGKWEKVIKHQGQGNQQGDGQKKKQIGFLMPSNNVLVSVIVIEKFNCTTGRHAVAHLQHVWKSPAIL